MNTQHPSILRIRYLGLKVLLVLGLLVCLGGAWKWFDARAAVDRTGAAASAPFVYQVKDINPKTALGFTGRAVVGNNLYFGAGIWKHNGNGVWKSDGTTSGTVKVMDTYPPDNFTAAGAGFFYTEDNYDTNFNNLYYSDGTPNGTRMLKSWNENDCYSPSRLQIDADILFIECDGPDQPLLWASDGTVTGTVKIGAFQNLYFMEAIGNTLYFAANKTSYSNQQLWKSDGTPGGTVMVKDINPASQDDYVVFLKNIQGTLFFGAYNGVDTYGLWKSNGTEGGTTQVKGFSSPAFGSPPANLTDVNGTLFFSILGSPSSLWKSDGSEAGTVKLKDINFIDSYSQFINANGVLFFQADDGVNGTELWRSDGSEAGTAMVKDINPGINPGLSSDFTWKLMNLNGILFFNADDGVNGVELWKSDGTPGGTMLVKDIHPGAGSTKIDGMTPLGGKMLFFADAGTGLGLWQSDGTTDGTILVKLLTPISLPSSPTGMYEFNGQAFFAADDGEHGFELWKSDGSAASTVMVTDIYSGSESGLTDQYYNNIVGFGLGQVASVGSTLFFVANDGVHGSELWKTDGTAAGTSLVKDILPGPEGDIYAQFTTFKGELFFAGESGYGGLWKSDGTEAGTELIQQFTNTAGIGSFLPIGDSLFFMNYANQWELWKTDGTISGTQLVRDGFVNNYVIQNEFTDVGGTLFFSASDGIHGDELWKSDGTLTGTLMVKDITPGNADSNPSGLANVNGVLYFSVGENDANSLWKSDGTVTGTVKIKDIPNIAGYDQIVYQDKYFLTASDNVHGYELWQSDGTNAGTFMVKDINPALNPGASSSPMSFTELDGILYFSAFTESGGRELWKTDGTSEGTVMVADIYPGDGSSGPAYLMKVAGLLLFSADGGNDGAELWALNTGAGLQPLYLPLVNR